MTVEIRKRTLMGTRYVQHSLVVDGAIVHEQLSPYSEDEIESRIRSHLNPTRQSDYRAPEFIPGRKGTAKSYGAKGGKAGRKTNAERDMPWLPPEGDE